MDYRYRENYWELSHFAEISRKSDQTLDDCQVNRQYINQAGNATPRNRHSPLTLTFTNRFTFIMSYTTLTSVINAAIIATEIAFAATALTAFAHALVRCWQASGNTAPATTPASIPELGDEFSDQAMIAKLEIVTADTDELEPIIPITIICEPINWDSWKLDTLRSSRYTQTFGVKIRPVGSRKKLPNADLIAQYEQAISRNLPARTIHNTCPQSA